jgi:predicted HTH domain antitoxin
MSVTIDLPKNIEDILTAAWGPDLSRAAKEAIAVEGMRAGLLSVGQVAEILNLSIDGADAFLKARGVFLPYSDDDLERDLASLNRALGT